MQHEIPALPITLVAVGWALCLRLPWWGPQLKPRLSIAWVDSPAGDRRQAACETRVVLVPVSSFAEDSGGGCYVTTLQKGGGGEGVARLAVP